MKEKLAKLMDLKSIITLLVTLTLCYMTVIGKLDIKDFMLIAGMVFTYYFNRKSNTN